MNNNFINTQKLILNIYSKAKMIKLQNPPSTNISTLDPIIFNDLYENLKDLYNYLSTINTNKILLQGIFDRNYIELSFIKAFLLEIKSQRGRSYHDKIFIKIFNLESKHLPLGITRVFEEFIKGITYFQKEEENKKKIPIYHRAASCGDSSNSFRKKYLQCYNENLEENLEEKKSHIFKCYLERLIYDDMYKNLTLHFPGKLENNETKQNQGHLFQLGERAKNFNSCFIGVKLKIKIYYENNFPSVLIIEFIKDDVVVKKETYMKQTYKDIYDNTVYSNNVYVEINENNNMVEKIQTY